MYNILNLLVATAIFHPPTLSMPLLSVVTTPSSRTAALIARGKELYALHRSNGTALGNTPRVRYLPPLLSRRAEPNTGEDEFPDDDPHPNHLDQVETAFKDAFDLCSAVLGQIDNDIDIFPHYFNGGDRSNVKNVFLAIYGTYPDQEGSVTGNEMLGNIYIEQSDRLGLCADGRTLAYSKDDDDPPYINLCPNAFKKKAITLLNGADINDDPQYYQNCDGLGDNVSYKMNVLGVTILHEYMHYDDMLEYIFEAPIVDQEDGDGNPIGYGPVAVYDNLDKSLARLNADSYAYYAAHSLYSLHCGTFGAPVAGVDDTDPDCGNAACVE